MRKALKITLYILGGILLLVSVVIIWLTTPSGENFVRGRVVAFLEKKLKTEVRIGGLDYRLPKMIELEDVFFRDQRNDTLLAVSRLRVDIDMVKLLSNKVEVQEIQLSGGTVNIYRTAPDTLFNFDYIVKAFAAPPDSANQNAPTDSSGQFQLDIKDLTLNDIDIRFNDYTGGSLFAINVDTLHAGINKVDPYSMDFRLKNLYVDGLRSSFIIDTSYLANVTDTDTTAPMPYLAADELDLRNIDFSFTDKNDPFLFAIAFKKLLAHPKEIDLNKQYVAVNDFAIDRSLVKIQMGEKVAREAAEIVDTLIEANLTPAQKWRVLANSIKLNGVDFAMDDISQPRMAYGIDYAHLSIKDFVLDAEQVLYTTDTIFGNINHLAATEQSGLVINELRTTFAYHPQGGYLRNLYLETPNTVLRDFAEVRYPSLEALQTRMQTMQLKINLRNSVVGMKDVLLFAPDLRSQPLFRKYSNDRVKVTAAVTGFLDALTIQRLQMQGIGNTYVDVSGKLNGLPDANKINYDLKIAKLQSNKEVVNSLLPPAVLKQVNLPSTFSIAGRVSGNMTDYNTDLVATTSDGNANIKGTLSIAGGRERYNMVVRTDRLNIGKIIRQDSIIGRISANVSAKGSGFDVKYMNAMLKGEIQSAAFMGYNYSNISFNAKVAKQVADVDLVSNDPNAVLTLNGQANFKNKYPAIVAKLVIDSANLHALNLSKDELRVRGVVDANIEEMNPDYPRGIVTMGRPTIVLKGQRYFLDSMYIASKPNADSGNYIVISTDAVQAVLTGRTPLTQIGNIVQSHINRHYAINDADSARAIKAAPTSYDLHLAATMVDRPLMRVLLPGLQSMDTVKIEAGFTPGTLFVNADAPRVQFNNMLFVNTKANVSGGDTGLNYNVTLDRFEQNNLLFYYASATGSIFDQNITSRVRISDSARNERFGLGVVFHQHADRQELHVEDGLKLNYKDWQVSQPNAIVFSNDGFYVQNFRISNGGESISLNSETPQFSAPMAIAINNFLISNITEIVSRDTLLANGVLNGNLRLRNTMQSPEVSGNVAINDLSVMNDTIGNVTADLASASANTINARIAINGRGNDVAVNGFYYPTPVNGNNFDLDMRVNTLNVQSFEGLAMGQIKNSSGYIRGNLKIQGTMTAPRVTGDLRTDNLSTNITAIGATYNMPAERITFRGDRIEFQNFKLVDKSGKAGVIDGYVTTTDLNNMQLGLRFNANRFEVLNSAKEDHEMFYGRLLISSDLRINGTAMAPELDGNITIHDSTNLTVVVPQAEPGMQEREGVVEFIDMSDTSRYKLLAANHTDTIPELSLRSGADLNVNIALEEEAEFNVIIDEGTGDFLRVRGTANLNTTLNPDGTMGITGIYELKEGAYELNYNFIKRRFEIEPGSTIVFAGDPLNAQINVTAVYTANVPPYDLVQQQVQEPAQLVYFKQRLPFEVQLKLSGELMKPVIAFDVVLPEDATYASLPDVTALVQSKLSQIRSNESELNKQVFAVLLLNRFVSENPFESGTGTDAQYLARQSVSRFMSEQLNKFAKDLISGVELTLDLQTTEDYTTGQKRNRTDLNVAASRRLLNDRLKITVGNNFELEGQNQNRNQNSSLIPGNLAADYELTSDGRYMVRLYRTNEQENVLDGYVVETGARFIVTAEYNRFRNLFINRKKRMREMREQRQQERAKGAGN